MAVRTLRICIISFLSSLSLVLCIVQTCVVPCAVACMFFSTLPLLLLNSEADPAAPGTDNDVDYYQHKSTFADNFMPWRTGWELAPNNKAVRMSWLLSHILCPFQRRHAYDASIAHLLTEGGTGKSSRVLAVMVLRIVARFKSVEMPNLFRVGKYKKDRSM